MAKRLLIGHVFLCLTIGAGCSGDPASGASVPLDAGPGADAADSSRPVDASVVDGSDATDGGSDACSDPLDLIATDGTCNTLVYPATRVPFTVGTGTGWVPVGGALVDGLYSVVKMEGWNTTSGSGRQMSIVVTSGGTKILVAGLVLNADGTGDADAGLPWMRANYTVSIASTNQLSLSEDCSVGTASFPGTLLYTATTTNPPQLMLGGTTGAAVTYERQGCVTGY